MKNVKNEQVKNSGLPLAIIVLVLIAVVAGGFWFYTSSKSTPDKAKKTPPANANIANVAATAPAGAQPPDMLGSPTASVTVEEFGDFQCPSCSQVHPMMKEIQSIYGPRIKFVWRNYPLAIPAHDKAYDAAVAAVAAGMKGKFWAMLNELYTNQQEWSGNQNFRQIWGGYAQKIGLDVDKFQNDIAGLGAKTRVDEDLKRGRALGVNSTPSIFVNGRLVPYDDISVTGIRQMIDTELQQANEKAKAGTAKTAAPANAAPANAQ
jgi:protein-disulfide isomerase